MRFRGSAPAESARAERELYALRRVYGRKGAMKGALATDATTMERFRRRIQAGGRNVHADSRARVGEGVSDHAEHPIRIAWIKAQQRFRGSAQADAVSQDAESAALVRDDGRE